jgi:hypothetical protein
MAGDLSGAERGRATCLRGHAGWHGRIASVVAIVGQDGILDHSGQQFASFMGVAGRANRASGVGGHCERDSGTPRIDGKPTHDHAGRWLT